MECVCIVSLLSVPIFYEWIWMNNNDTSIDDGKAFNRTSKLFSSRFQSFMILHGLTLNPRLLKLFVEANIKKLI